MRSFLSAREETKEKEKKKKKRKEDSREVSRNVDAFEAKLSRLYVEGKERKKKKERRNVSTMHRNNASIGAWLGRRSYRSWLSFPLASREEIGGRRKLVENSPLPHLFSHVIILKSTLYRKQNKGKKKGKKKLGPANNRRGAYVWREIKVIERESMCERQWEWEGERVKGREKGRTKKKGKKKETRTHSLKETSFFLLLSDLVMSLIRGCFSEN